MSDPAPEYNTLLGEIVQKWEDHLLEVRGASPARPQKKRSVGEHTCDVKPRWALDDLNVHCGYKLVEEECKKHGLSQYGALPAMVKRLRDHLVTVEHPDVARMAKSGTLTAF